MRDGHVVLLVRENVEDLYAAVKWMAAPGVAHAVKVATAAGCERIVRHGFRRAVEHGRKHLTLFHKANNLKLTEGMLLDGSASSAITTRAGSFSKWFARSERLERRPPTSAGQPAPRRSLPMSSSGSLAM